MELHSTGIQQMCGFSCGYCSWLRETIPHSWIFALFPFSLLFPTPPFPFFPLLSSYSPYSFSSFLCLYLSRMSWLPDLLLPSACSQSCSLPSATALPSSPPKRPSSLTSLSVLYRPTADDQRGRLYPLAVGASKLSRHYRALLFGRSYIEIDITGSHYQFFQRFSLSLLDISLPSVDQLRALLSADFIASRPHFLEQYPTSPKDLPTILLNSSLEFTLFYYRGKGYWPSHQVRALLHQISQTKPRLLAAFNQSLGPRTLSSLTSANLFFHTMEHPETLWLKSFTSYILSHHSTSSLIWLHDGIWLAPPPPSSLITAANLHATSALNLGDRPLLIKIRPCTSLYQRAWQLFQLPGPHPPDPPPLTSIPPPTLHPPLSEIEARRGFQRMMRNAMNPRALRPSMTTLVGARCVLTVQLTTIEGGPGFASSHPAHHHWGWPWIGNFFSSFYYLPYSSSSSLAAPPAGIQSDSDPKWSSSCFFSAGCCHAKVQSDLLYPSLRKGRGSL